jgi:hypothetical protein
MVLGKSFDHIVDSRWDRILYINGPIKMLFRTLVGLVVVIGSSFGSSISTVIVIVVRQMLEGFATATTGIKNTGRNNEAL